MKHTRAILVTGILVLAVSSPVSAQTPKKVTSTKPTITAKPTTVRPAPAQQSLDDAFTTATTQAKTDRAKIIDQLRADQAKESTEALCRIALNQFYLESINEFETRAADLKLFTEQHRTQIESERAALTRALEELPNFTTDVLPVELQSKVEQLGLVKFVRTNDGAIQISLEQVVRFLDLINARIKYCSKDPATRQANLQQVIASLESPFSNPLGLTYSQVMAAIQALSTKLNSSLKIQNSEFQLRFADPIQDQTCDAGLELVQNIRVEGGSSLKVVMKLAPSTTAGAIKAIHGPQANFPYPNELVFRSINESNLGQTSGKTQTPFDGYARLLLVLRRSPVNEGSCLESLTQTLTEGYLDAPYMSPNLIAQTSTLIRIDPVADTFKASKNRYDFGQKHGLFLDSKNTLWAWGADSGFDGSSDYETPARREIGYGLSVQQFAAGAKHTFLLLSDGTVRVYGLGKSPALVEVQLDKASPVTRIFAAGDHSLAIHQNGRIEGFNSLMTPFTIALPNREVPRDFTVSNDTIFILSQEGRLYSFEKSTPGQVAKVVPGSENLLIDQIDFGVGIYAVSRTGELYWLGAFNLPGTTAATHNVLTRIAFEKGKIKSAQIKNSAGFLLLTDGTLWSIGAAITGQAAGTFANPTAVTTPIKNIQKMWFGGATLWIQSDQQVWGIGKGNDGELGHGLKANSTQFVRPNLPKL